MLKLAKTCSDLHNIDLSEQKDMVMKDLRLIFGINDKQCHSICEDILDNGVEHDPKVTRSKWKSSEQDNQLKPTIADS